MTNHMAQANNKKEILYQNLIDAGCDEELTQKCMELAESNNSEKMIAILTGCRKSMLACIHEKSKCIACLDFLIYRLEKENK